MTETENGLAALGLPTDAEDALQRVEGDGDPDTVTKLTIHCAACGRLKVAFEPEAERGIALERARAHERVSDGSCAATVVRVFADGSTEAISDG